MLRRYRALHPGSSLGHMLVFAFCRNLCRAFLTGFYRTRSTGKHHVAQHGSLLIIANHQSFLDPPLVGSYLGPRHTDFIARGGLFSFKPLGMLIARLNSIPVGEGASETAAIKEALRRLKLGRAVILFPEGSRSPDGALRPFKRGIALLVKKAGCPVVPAAIEGVHDAWPRGNARPFLLGKRVAVKYAEPIPHAELMADGPDAALRRLETQIDAMRLELRAELRAHTRGRYPPAGPADAPYDAESAAAAAESENAD
jgi:1-acyl-sn-glycerol-3-phosphate acyltransferase